MNNATQTFELFVKNRAFRSSIFLKFYPPVQESDLKCS